MTIKPLEDWQRGWEKDWVRYWVMERERRNPAVASYMGPPSWMYLSKKRQHYSRMALMARNTNGTVMNNITQVCHPVGILSYMMQHTWCIEGKGSPRRAYHHWKYTGGGIQSLYRSRSTYTIGHMSPFYHWWKRAPLKAQYHRLQSYVAASWNIIHFFLLFTNVFLGYTVQTVSIWTVKHFSSFHCLGFNPAHWIWNVTMTMRLNWRL